MAITALTPLSIWVQLGSFFFLLAGIFSDVLIIRICLFNAYSFLFINSILGSPLWPNVISGEGIEISVDGLVWSILNLYVAASGVIRLLLDESQVRLPSNEEEALWRMFYRLGGVSRKIFQAEISRRLKVVKYAKGQHIPTEEVFNVIYTGEVRLDLYKTDDRGELTWLSQEFVGSRSMFDFRHLGLLHRSLGHSLFSHAQTATATTDVVVFQFGVKEIREISALPSLRGVWQSVFLGDLACIASNHYNGQGSVDSPNAYPYDSEYVHPIFSPLEPFEEPSPFAAGSGKALRHLMQHLCHSLARSLALPWPVASHPTGLRHADLAMPPTCYGSRRDSTPRRDFSKVIVIDSSADARAGPLPLASHDDAQQQRPSEQPDEESQLIISHSV